MTLQPDPTKMTRAQAERAVARTADSDELRALAGHRNTHVQKKTARKLDSPEERRQGFQPSSAALDGIKDES